MFGARRKLGLVAGGLLAALFTALVNTSAAHGAQAVTPSSRCSVLASGGSCSFGVPFDPDVPYAVTVPDGLSTLDVVMAAGGGANGDYGAIGGAGGVVVVQIPVPSSQRLLLYVGSNARSYNSVGAGWASGGKGVRAGGGIGSGDSGAGGGASAVVDGGASGTVLAVAGGGGGAGGSYNDISVGGSGGAGGLPAGRGGFGGGVYNNYGAGGYGGAGGGASQPNGTNGGSTITPAGGGGGGGGWLGGLGGGPATEFTASGGGGGGGESYVDPNVPGAGNAIYAGSVSSGGGSITLSPGGHISVYPCNQQYNTNVNFPPSTGSIFAVLAGASGTYGSDRQSVPGQGAVVTSRLNLNGEQTIAVTPGCRSGVGFGRGGHRGDAGHAAGSDGGNGGGGSAIVDPRTGGVWLVAGGGGGAGGASGVDNQHGGVGGDAGLSWWSSGAGWGGSGQGGDSPAGGAGGANTANGQPVTYGDSPSEVHFLGGGAGAGGGGGQGGQGGDTFNEIDGGGGGGAGSSVYDPTHAVSPTVAVSSAAYADGYVAIVQLPTASNVAVKQPPASSPPGVGSLTLTARVTGNDARSHRSTTFSIMVACRAGGHDIRLAAGRPPIFGLTAGRSRTINQLPLGAVCHIVQIDAAGATQSTIEPSAVRTITKTGTAITVSNRFDVGSLAVRVLVPPRTLRVHSLVRVYVLCKARRAPQGLRYPLPHRGNETVRIGRARVLTGVPAGADCAVAPLDHRLASSARVDRHAVVRAGRQATLTITDHALTRHFSLQVAAAGALAGRGVVLDVQPDEQVTISPGPHGGVRLAAKAVPSAGFVQIVNNSAKTIVFTLSRGGVSTRRGRVRPRAVAWFNP